LGLFESDVIAGALTPEGAMNNEYTGNCQAKTRDGPTAQDYVTMPQYFPNGASGCCQMRHVAGLNAL